MLLLLALALAQLVATSHSSVSDAHSAPVSPPPHLKIMGFYGMGPYNLELMTKGKDGGGTLRTPWVTHMMEGRFVDQVQVYKSYRIPSFYGDMSSRYEVPEGAEKIFLREKDCQPASYPVCRLGSQWESTLDMLVERDIKPGLSNGTLVGVFLGDELCCEDTPARTGMQCWDTVLKPVADRLRTLLGPKALIYTNECGGEAMWNSTMIAGGWKIPASLDVVSTDYYAGWLPPGTQCPKAAKCPWCPTCPCFNTSGLCPEGATDAPATEVSHMRDFIEHSMLPAMHPHQRILAVPGTFGCHAVDLYNQTTPMSNASSEAAVVEKLSAWLAYAEEEERIIGFKCVFPLHPHVHGICWHRPLAKDCVHRR
eukprot:COSAG02_NODE_8109_length_2706_cov_1.925201_1_plen_367_part_00